MWLQSFNLKCMFLRSKALVFSLRREKLVITCRERIPFRATRELIPTPSSVLLSGISHQSAVAHVTREAREGLDGLFQGNPLLTRRWLHEGGWAGGERGGTQNVIVLAAEVRPPRVNRQDVLKQLSVSPGTLRSPALFVTRIYMSFSPTQQAAAMLQHKGAKGYLPGKYGTAVVYACSCWLWVSRGGGCLVSVHQMIRTPVREVNSRQDASPLTNLGLPVCVCSFIKVFLICCLRGSSSHYTNSCRVELQRSESTSQRCKFCQVTHIRACLRVKEFREICQEVSKCLVW